MSLYQVSAHAVLQWQLVPKTKHSGKPLRQLRPVP